MTAPITRTMVNAALAGATTTRQVVIEPGGMGAVAPFLQESFPGRPAMIVADETTWSIAGEELSTLLARAGVELAEPVIFPASPTLRPDTRHIAVIRAAFPEGPVVPIAVGSGSINDLVKRSAHEHGLPYISVATAASMDGYTASGAALIDNGVKQTFPCDAPVAVFADLGIVSAAPASMTASGYGDLIGKVTAGSDWLIADALGIEPIVPHIWEMVQGPLPAMLADPARYRSGDPAAIEQLFLGLVMTGLAIQASGSTRCASGSEHQFSHLWEMRGLEHEGELVSHGVKVGVGSVFSGALYDRLLARDWTTLDVDEAVAAWPSLEQVEAEIRAMPDSEALIERALIECRAKHIDPEALRERLTRFRDAWPALKMQLQERMGPATIAALLDEAGAPSTTTAIGLDELAVRESYEFARRIRQRYTVLDLVAELGAQDALVDEVFGHDGYGRSLVGAPAVAERR